MKFSPLKVNEFIPVIAKNLVMYSEDFDMDNAALYKLSGLEAIHTYLKEKNAENEKNSKKKK